jgi:alkylation response protein AidB-like acyl-CoA dehydrogenase
MGAPVPGRRAHDRFPEDAADKRRVLLDAVASIRDVVTAHADEAERTATLPAATVRALQDSGLLALKLPAALGGAEADPVMQVDVIEELSAVDASAGWCLMVGATTVALPAVFLADEAVATIFAGGRAPLAAGCYMPTGHAVPEPGGYRISGRWAFASGIRHAAWVSGTAAVVRDDVPTGERRVFVVPVDTVQVHDTWQVAGLRGTGSCDFSVAELLVADAFTWDIEQAAPRRGGPVYRLGLPGFVTNEHAAFALGVARRALAVVTGMAAAKARGLRPTVLAHRHGFQHFVGEAELRLRGARALVVELNEAAWSAVSRGDRLSAREHTELRGAAVLATRIALDVVTQAFRYAGGSAVYDTSPLQRCLRDLNAGAQHFMVSDSAYEALGRFLLALPSHPME